MTLRVVQASTGCSDAITPTTTYNFPANTQSIGVSNFWTASPTAVWNTPTSGNLLLCWIRNSAGTVSTPAGWTLKDDTTISTYHHYMFYKVSDGTESSLALTISSSSDQVGYLIEIEGADTSGDPFEDLDYLSTAEASPVDLPTITTTAAASLLGSILLSPIGTTVSDVSSGYVSHTTSPTGYTWATPMHFGNPGTSPAASDGAQFTWLLDESGAGSKDLSITHSLGVDCYGLFFAIKENTEVTDLTATAEGSVVTVVQSCSDGSGSTSGAAFTFNGSTTVSTAGCSDTWTTPTSGNVLVCIAGYETTDETLVSPPSGFTQIQENETIGIDVINVSYKISDGSETTVTVPSVAGGKNVAILLEISGLDTSALIESNDQDPGYNGAVANVSNLVGTGTSTAAGTASLIYGMHHDGRSDSDVYTFYNGKMITASPSQGCSGGTGTSDPTIWYSVTENQDNRATHKGGVGVTSVSNRNVVFLTGGIIVFKTTATAAAGGGGGGSDGGTNLTSGTNLSRGTGLALPTAGLAIQ